MCAVWEHHNRSAPSTAVVLHHCCDLVRVRINIDLRVGDAVLHKVLLRPETIPAPIGPVHRDLRCYRVLLSIGSDPPGSVSSGQRFPSSTKATAVDHWSNYILLALLGVERCGVDAFAIWYDRDEIRSIERRDRVDEQDFDVRTPLVEHLVNTVGCGDEEKA